MSEFQEFIDVATEAGFTNPQEGIITAFYSEKENAFFLLCQDSDDEDFYVSTFFLETEDFGQPLFESSDQKACLEFINNAS